MKPLGVCCGRDFFSRSEWAAHQRQHRIDKAGTEPAPTPKKKENIVSAIKSQGELVVVETDEDQFLGYIEDKGDTLVLRTGRAGHPVTLQRVDVESITPAKGHPYVEWL